MINFLSYLAFFLFSLGQLGRVMLNQGQINFYFYEISSFLLFILFFFKLGFQPFQQTLTKFRIIYYFVFFLIFSFLLKAFDFSINQNAISLLYLMRLIFYFVFPLYLYFFIKKNPGYKETLKKGLTASIFLVAAFSIAQYFFYPDLRNLYYLGWDPHLNRLFSVFFDTSVAASIFGLIFFYLYKNKRYWLSLPFLIFLILTFSRSAYIFFAITFLVDFSFHKDIKPALLILLLSVSVFILAPKQFGFGVGLDRVFSISSRIADYQKGIAMWQKSPLFGHGYNRLAYIKEKMNLKEIPKENFPIHSAASLSGSFLIILAASGLIGLILFVLSFIKLVFFNKNAFVYMLFLGLMSLTDNIILHPFILFLLGVIYVVSLPSGKSRLEF